MNNSARLFSVDLPRAAAEALARHPHVELVEEIGEVYVASSQTVDPYYSFEDGLWSSLSNKWHLDRIDQDSYMPNGQYNFCERASNVTAYVLDTGVMRGHNEFANKRADGSSRVRDGVVFAADAGLYPAYNPCGGYTTDLAVSHGTAVASVLGGQYIGVAKNVNIVPLRVSACDSAVDASDPVATTERMCWALDWIKSANNPDRAKRSYWNTSQNAPALVSMSTFAYTNTVVVDGVRKNADPYLGALESVINGLLKDDPGSDWRGIPVVASANNQDTADNRTSPARMAYRNRLNFETTLERRVISVGGLGQRLSSTGQVTEARWDCPMYDGEPCWPVYNPATLSTVTYGSNYGPTVDIYAPAHNVTTASMESPSSYRTLHESRSGTSFAAPVVAGIVARILQAEPTLDPLTVWQRLRDTAGRSPSYFDSTPITSVPNHISSPLGNNLFAKRTGMPTCSPELP